MVEINVLGRLFLLSTLTILQISATAIQPPPQFHQPVFLEHPHVINRRQTNQPIRITSIYDTDAATSFITPQQRAHIENIIMANITNFFSNLLSVKPLGVPIRSPSACNGTHTTVQFNNFESFAPGCYGTCSGNLTCGPAVIPKEHMLRCLECDIDTLACEYSPNSTEGAGVIDTDFVLYVTTSNISCTDTYAYASSCSQEYALNRPIIGYVNFCPLSFLQDITDAFLITIIKHEIIHALGFASHFYAYFRDENGNPRTPRTDQFNSVPLDSNGIPVPSESTVRSVTYDWDTANGELQFSPRLIVTPNVVREVRNHFGCCSLEGAELESGGGSGSIGSHWDLRIFGNELMISVIFTADMPLSRITLALLEDSGWYRPNYDMAEDFLGNNVGCNSVTQSCLGYYNRDDVKEENVFCFQEEEQGCTFTRDFIGFCEIFNSTSQLPALNQYLSDPNKGGFEFADYCPFYSGIFDCTNSTAQRGLPVYSTGSNSRCFNHIGDVNVSVGNTSNTAPFTKSGCYQYSCNTTGVYVTVGSTEYECRNRGDVVTVEERVGGDTYTFSLVCPSCESICWDRLELCGSRSCPSAATVLRGSITILLFAGLLLALLV